MKYALPLALILSLGACAVQTGMPMGNNMAQIDISAAPVYGRAGAQRLAFQQAAKTTLELGYDKFTVVNNGSWNENGISGGSYGSASVNQFSGSASGGGFFSSHRDPESTMIIHMYHYHDKGAAGAVDAHAMLEKKK